MYVNYRARVAFAFAFAFAFSVSFWQAQLRALYARAKEGAAEARGHSAPAHLKKKTTLKVVRGPPGARSGGGFVELVTHLLKGR